MSYSHSCLSIGLKSKTSCIKKSHDILKIDCVQNLMGCSFVFILYNLEYYIVLQTMPNIYKCTAMIIQL